MTKYIFVTGGVVSGLGKGITAASLGMMLKAKGLKVIAQKLDPYLNLAPSMMSPLQHGEVFVTEDGAETDLDLGHYERFIDVNLNIYSSLTSGRIYHNILENERNGVYQGQTIQVIPHVTDEIRKFVYAVGKKINADVVISEIGGTAGDIESLPHIEAIRQVSNEVGRENCLFVHVTLAPTVKETGEMKSKPTQHSVRELRSLGVSPNLIVVRCDRAIDDQTRAKIAMFCDVPADCVIENRDVPLLYEVPLMLEKSSLAAIVTRELNLPENPPDTREWEKMLAKTRGRKKSVNIALVGKYVDLHDAYLSASEALTHAGIENDANILLNWIHSEKVTAEHAAEIFKDADGVIVPAFGDSGIDGLICTAQYCRAHKIPYLGLGLGMHTAVIEFARNVIGIEAAASREFRPGAEHKIIEEGEMQLGASELVIEKGTALYDAYRSETAIERHRGRFVLNNAYIDQLSAGGMTVSAFNADKSVAEAVELSDHPFFVGVQYLPEFKSRPHKPHPLFVKFVEKALLNN